MREYMNIVNEASEPTGFVLAPGFDPANYKMGDTLQGADRWQAMTYMGDGTIGKGKMAQVGYLWISRVDNTVVPISVGDEHHLGRDMIGGLVRKGKLKINMADYTPISVNGHNFVYSKDDVVSSIPALKKWLAWGGKDGLMRGSYDMDGLMMTYKQFVASKGNVALKTGTLAPLGQHFIDLHQTLQNAILAARETDKRPVIAKAFKAGADILAFLGKLSYKIPAKGFGGDKLHAMADELKALGKEGDLQGLSDLFFGFHSAKRAVHEYMRHEKPESVFYRELTAFWGDMKLAENMLAHL